MVHLPGYKKRKKKAVAKRRKTYEKYRQAHNDRVDKAFAVRRACKDKDSYSCKRAGRKFRKANNRTRKAKAKYEKARGKVRTRYWD